MLSKPFIKPVRPYNDFVEYRATNEQILARLYHELLLKYGPKVLITRMPLILVKP